MCRPAAGRTAVLVCCVALLVISAGCAGLGGDSSETATQPDEESPALLTDATATVDEDTAEALRETVTDEDGALTETGNQFLERLDAATALDTQQRTAVLESVVLMETIDEETLATLDALLASPDPFAAEALASGLEDTNGDGLLDGEATALGLDSAETASRIASLAVDYRADGYDERELTVLRRLGSLDTFGWRQATQLRLLDALSPTPTADAVEAIEDDSGDGLINAMAGHLELNRSRERPKLAATVRQLEDQAYTLQATQFLREYAVVVDNETTRQQFQSLGLDKHLETGIFTPEATKGIADDDDDGLINAMEAELGLDQREADPAVASVTHRLAPGGYDDTELAYLERVTELRSYRGHDYEYWAQADQLGLFDEAIANGTATERQLWMLQNNASNRLLNGMEVSFGTDPEQADTSGDGYPDHLLWGPMQDLGLDVRPASPNVFVEVDTASGIEPPSEAQITAVQETFASEPPEDIGPINVQFEVCNTEQADISNFEDFVDIGDDGLEDTPDPTAGQRNITGLGFQYLFLTDGIVSRGTLGFAPSRGLMDAAGIRSFAVVDGRLWRTGSELEQAGTIAHELGHVLGLHGTAFEGIDSREYTADEYASVMNYNYPVDDITFSTGDPFNDYEQMYNQSFGSQYQDQSALQAMWENGTVDQDALCSP